MSSLTRKLDEIIERLWTSSEHHMRLGTGWISPCTPPTALQEAAELACTPFIESPGRLLQLMYEVQAERCAQFAQLAYSRGLSITVIQQPRRVYHPAAGQPGQDSGTPQAQQAKSLDELHQALAAIVRKFFGSDITSSPLRTCETDSVLLDDQPSHDSRPADVAVVQLMSLAEEAVAQAAASFNVDVASLRARVRIALFCPSWNREQSIRLVTEEQAEALRKGREAIASLFISKVDDHSTNLTESRLVRLSSDIGSLISSAAHYLQSARPGSAHFGLEDSVSRQLIAYASVSRQDWDVIVDGLRPINSEETELFSLSRIYATDMAPRNTVSRLLALLIKEYSAVGRSVVMSTTVDPNLGFRGTSYRAANWIEFFSIPHLGYLYVDGQFCTRRQLIRTFGSDNPDRLVDLLGARFQMSGPLQYDTLVFVTATDRSLRHALRKMRPRRLERKIGLGSSRDRYLHHRC